MTANIDPQEIATFNAQAENWWDPKGSFQSLHAINPLRLKFITDITPLADKRIIDIGCGGGILAEGMAKQGADVTGIDMGEQTLKAAQTHAEQQQLKISYEQITVEEKAKQSKKKFDIITCMEMLEHVPDPVSIINACAKLVKADGHIFFSTINRNAKAYLFAILGAEYCLKLLPKGTHSYEKFIKPSELSAWLRSANLQTKQMAGIGYNPLTKHYSLNQTTDVNYLLHCQMGK
jgi:2-polyprenyl-6-hydroxyphenyl methylase/3-demethylubiquinone-9 3-methyltransferase